MSVLGLGSAVRRIRRNRSAIEESVWSTYGGIMLTAGVDGLNGCRLSTKLNSGSFVVQCTVVLYV